jgi:flagellar protein FliS
MANVAPDSVAEAYASTAKNTLSGPMLLVKLYERLMLDIVSAKATMSNDIAATHDSLIHAQRIVRVLRTSLQPELFRGGQELLELYESLEAALLKANMNKDPEPLDLCKAIVEPLLEAWSAAAARYMSEAMKEAHDVVLAVG